MKAHIFYKDNALFVTQESIPEKPSTKYFRSEESIDATGKALSKYFDEIAAIKGRAVRVGNHYEVFGILFREQVKEEFKNSPDAFRAWREKHVIESQLYSLPENCEVKLKCNCTPETCDGPHCDRGGMQVATILLSPSKVVEKEESQDEWFKVFNVCTQMEKYAAIETLQSLYTITRRS